MQKHMRPIQIVGFDGNIGNAIDSSLDCSTCATVAYDPSSGEYWKYNVSNDIPYPSLSRIYGGAN